MLAALLLLGFAGGADAEGYRVSASEILAAAEGGEPLEYDGAIVEGDLDLIECGVYGSGVRPLRTLGWMLGLVLLFGLLFINGGSIRKYIRVEEERTMEELGDSNAVEIHTTLRKRRSHDDRSLPLQPLDVYL
ncbi:MAG: hypothetical protein JW986_00050 [Methanotrichaceae archaeon]|nr:hypothetical protein [Methanotrichaceae archaeon]